MPRWTAIEIRCRRKAVERMSWLTAVMWRAGAGGRSPWPGSELWSPQAPHVSMASGTKSTPATMSVYFFSASTAVTHFRNECSCTCMASIFPKIFCKSDPWREADCSDTPLSIFAKVTVVTWQIVYLLWYTFSLFLYDKIVFTVRRCVSAVCAVVVCPSVCPTVRVKATVSTEGNLVDLEWRSADCGAPWRRRPVRIARQDTAVQCRVNTWTPADTVTVSNLKLWTKMG